MQVLIVESTAELAMLWQRHLERQGLATRVASTAEEAVTLISEQNFDAIILDLILKEGSALAVADYAQYRRPETKLVFVTDTTFFSDGSLFALVPNARAFLQSKTPPEDLAALVQHYLGVA